jgi:hypothetical protein
LVDSCGVSTKPDVNNSFLAIESNSDVSLLIIVLVKPSKSPYSPASEDDRYFKKNLTNFLDYDRIALIIEVSFHLALLE